MATRRVHPNNSLPSSSDATVRVKTVFISDSDDGELPVKMESSKHRRMKSMPYSQSIDVVQKQGPVLSKSLLKRARGKSMKNLHPIPSSQGGIFEKKQPLKTPLTSFLVLAAQQGKYMEVQKLLDAQGDPNQTDARGRSGIWHACSNGHVNCVKLLLKYRARADVADIDGQTPLMVVLEPTPTAKESDSEASDEEPDAVPLSLDIRIALLELLLSVRMNWEARRGVDGLAAIHLAAACGHTELMVRLLDVMPPSLIDLQDISGRTALQHALLASDVAMCGLLLAHGAQKNVNPLGERWQQLLHQASAMGDVQCVSRLLDIGCPLNVKDSQTGTTPLHVACAGGFSDVASVLLEAGADPAATDARQSRHCLHRAAESGEVKVIRTVLSHVEDEDQRFNLLHLRDQHGRLPLHYACLSDSTGKCVHELLKADVHPKNKPASSVSMRDAGGATPMHLALENGDHVPLLEALVKYGADISCKDNMNRTPLSLAREWGNTESVFFLMQCEAEKLAAKKAAEPEPPKSKYPRAGDLLESLKKEVHGEPDVAVLETAIRDVATEQSPDTPSIKVDEPRVLTPENIEKARGGVAWDAGIPALPPPVSHSKPSSADHPSVSEDKPADDLSPRSAAARFDALFPQQRPRGMSRMNTVADLRPVKSRSSFSEAVEQALLEWETPRAAETFRKRHMWEARQAAVQEAWDPYNDYDHRTHHSTRIPQLDKPFTPRRPSFFNQYAYDWEQWSRPSRETSRRHRHSYKTMKRSRSQAALSRHHHTDRPLHADDLRAPRQGSEHEEVARPQTVATTTKPTSKQRKGADEIPAVPPARTPSYDETSLRTKSPPKTSDQWDAVVPHPQTPSLPSSVPQPPRTPSLESNPPSAKQEDQGEDMAATVEQGRKQLMRHYRSRIEELSQKVVDLERERNDFQTQLGQEQAHNEQLQETVVQFGMSQSKVGSQGRCCAIL